MKTILLDGNMLTDRMTAHKYLKDMLEFPQYYGENLDALYDCVAELDHMEIEILKPERANVFYHKILSIFRRAQKETGIKITEIENFEYNE